MYDTITRMFMEKMILSIFKPSLMRAVGTVTAHSLEGSISGTNKIIEGVTQGKKESFALCSSIIQ